MEECGSTLPLGADVASAFNLGWQALSLSVGAHDLVKRATGDPAAIVRVQLTFVFPSGER
jgi:hypothetical protein